MHRTETRVRAARIRPTIGSIENKFLRYSPSRYRGSLVIFLFFYFLLHIFTTPLRRRPSFRPLRWCYIITVAKQHDVLCPDVGGILSRMRTCGVLLTIRFSSRPVPNYTFRNGFEFLNGGIDTG